MFSRCAFFEQVPLIYRELLKLSKAFTMQTVAVLIEVTLHGSRNHKLQPSRVSEVVALFCLVDVFTR